MEKGFETLIAKNECDDRWYPTPIEHFKFAFKIDAAVENSRALKSNLAYSAQYLEFLEKEISELKLSSVIYTMLVKTYVITGMSMLEGLFSNIIKSHGWWKMTSLESLGTTQASPTNFGDKQYIIKTELLYRVDERPQQMTLDEMIKKLSHHHEALQVDHTVYPTLRRLKDLRNRIHLQMTDSNTDHDYNAFDFSVKKEMGAILYEILTSETVSDHPGFFEFLKKNTLDTYIHS